MYHSFKVNIAKKYGVEEAIFLNNIYYWITFNKASNKHFYDGYYWTYNTQEAFTKLFPYMSRSKIQRVTKKLEKEGLLKTANYNKVGYDRTKWYSLTTKGENILRADEIDIVQNEQSNKLKKEKSPTSGNIDIVQNEQSNVQNEQSIVQNEPTIPYINTYINTDTTTTIENNDGGSFKEITNFFEQNGFGLLNMYTKEDLIDLSEAYTSDWLLDAMKIAVDNNIRKLSYVRGILKKWKADGKDIDNRNVGGSIYDHYEKF